MHEGVWIEVSQDAWRYWSSDGELLKEIPHRVKYCPAVVFTSMDNQMDWWSSDAHSGLAEATLFVGYKAAAGAWVSEVSGNYLTTIAGDLEKLPDGQKLGHFALPIQLPLGTKVDVQSRIVPPQHYLQEIAARIAMACTAEGIPPGAITMQSNQNDWGTLSISVESSRLSVLRDLQVPSLKTAEKSLWPYVCDMLRVSSHRLAKVLPSGDEVTDALRVSFPDLSSPAEALMRIKVLKEGLSLGLSSPADFLMAARPEETRDDVVSEQQMHIAEYVDTIEPLVTRNTPAEAPAAEGYQTQSQTQGRTGGLSSGRTRAAQDNDE